MSLTLAIALNVVLDLGILGVLAFATTRPSRLRPHRPQDELLAAVTTPAVAKPAPHRERATSTRRRSELAAARS
jgi:hypothetical protein